MKSFIKNSWGTKIFYNGSLLICLSLFVISCSPPKVSSFVNEEAQFEAYGSYGIESPIENLEEISEEAKDISDRMGNYIKREMNDRKYRENNYPDITVFYQIVVDKSVDYDVNQPQGYNARYYRYQPYSYDYITERVKKEGVMIIDIKETYTGRLVWQGSLKLTYVRNSDHPLEESVRRIFADFPYEANNPDPVVIN